MGHPQAKGGHPGKGHSPLHMEKLARLCRLAGGDRPGTGELRLSAGVQRRLVWEAGGR